MLTRTTAKALCSRLGLFLFIVGVFVLVAPGRIDSHDGQMRYDVARSLVFFGDFQLRNEWTLHSAVPGSDGGAFSFYGPLSSMLGSVFVAVAVWLGGKAPQEMFMFSLAIAVPAALAVVLLYGTWIRWGVSVTQARLWALLFALGTPWLYYSTSTLDQAHQGFLLLCAALFGFRAAERDSAVLALLSGVAYGLVLNCQETFVVLAPFAAACVWQRKERAWVFVRSQRFWAFVGGVSLLFVFVLLFNYVRFGSPFDSGKTTTPHPPARSTVARSPRAPLQPGKSVFLYHPLIILGALGWSRFARERWTEARFVALFAGAHFGLISCLAFWAGDWCWGPRYLVLTLPLLALPWPFISARIGRYVLPVLVVLGLAVQILAGSVPAERWFFVHNKTAYFWLEPDAQWEWSTSPIVERPQELIVVASQFETAGLVLGPSPYPYNTSHYLVGSAPPGEGEAAARGIFVFSSLRPWPIWMGRLPPSYQVVPVDLGLALVCGLMLVGLLLHVVCGASERAGPARSGDND